jgi:hypothetical protein
MSASTDAQWSAMTKLVQTIFQRADAEPFRVPVAWKEMGLFDYPRIVKKPMDLGTVKKNIASKKYKSVTEAADDVRLVWMNCMTYNADGSDFYLLAKSLSKRFEEKYSKLAQEFQLDLTTSSGGDGGSSTPAAAGGPAAATSSSNGMVTLDERRAFARSLFKISKEDLGKIIVELDSKCPAALTKNIGEDEVEMNLDKVPPGLFRELKTFVDTSCVKQPAAAGSNKAAPKKKQ